MEHSNRFKVAFIASCVAIALALPILSFDFGVTEDEQLHSAHGESILDYFLGRSDEAARDPLDDEGELVFAYDEHAKDLSGALNIYGGFFDLLCAAARRYVSPFGKFETRHLINSLFGVLLIVFGGLSARRIAGWRAGTLALLLLALSPRLVGHSMNNPVDLPFAALYLVGVYFLVRFVEQLPRPRGGTLAALLIGIPLATNVRIAGLVLIAYLVLWTAAWCGLRTPRRRAEIVRAAAIAVLLGAGCYLLVSAPWPLAHADPLGTPLMALEQLSRLTTFDAYDLFEGRWIHRWEQPWYFAPKWLLIGTPLFVPLGLALFPVLFTARSERISRIGIALVSFAFLFPIGAVLLRGSYVYNDARHLLFAYPPLIVCCAVAFDTALRRSTHRLVAAGLVVLLAACATEPLHFMVRNHPNENVYFSPLIGGVDGAWGRYETDYWGNSVRAAVEWIQAETTPEAGEPLRIRLWYGDQTKAAYYIEREPGYVHVIAAEDSTRWDYHVLPTVTAKYKPEILLHWPLAGTVHEVRADETPLTAVVLNWRNREPEEWLSRMHRWLERQPSHAGYFTLASAYHHYGHDEAWLHAFRKAAELPPRPVIRTHDEYLEMGLELGRHGHHEESLAAYRLALRVDPDSAQAHFNVCATHDRLGRLEQARAACAAAVALDPSYAAEVRNLRMTGGERAPSR